MASSPPDAPSGQIRVVRIHKRVTEAYVVAASPAAALALATALRPGDWSTRTVLPEPGGDAFEYDAVAALAGSVTPPTDPAILREDGSYLLREDGSRILRETA